MKRFFDWPRRLDVFFDGRSQLPFAWGTNDCCMFAADGILAMTGQDIAKEYRGTYHTEMEAKRIFLRRGSLYAFATDISIRWSLNMITSRKAQRGDVVLVMDRYPTLGIVSLSGDTVVKVGEYGGLLFSDPKDIMCGWRI